MSLFGAFKNFLRGKAKDAEKKLADPTRDAEFAIEDSEKMIVEFKGKIAQGLASKKMQERKLVDIKNQAKKFGQIAEAAVNAGNDEDAEQALQQQASLEQQAKSMAAQIKQFDTDIANQRKRLNQVNNKITQSKSNLQINKMKHEGAKARIALNKATSDFNHDSPLAKLDELERVTNELEAQAEAEEEIAGESTSLEDTYLNKGPDVSDRLAKLKEKAGK